jgi:hypothetical protein
MTDHIKKVRTGDLMRKSTVSEAGLRMSNPAVKEAWESIQAIKKTILEEKKAAASAIDARYGDDLARAEKDYATILKLHLI